MKSAAVTLTATPQFQLLGAPLNTYKKGQHKKSVIRIVRRKTMKANLMASLVRSAKGRWGSAMTCARLFYNYLRLSPSYAAGCVHKARGLGQKLNRHGSKVLACVEKYRDVHQTSFDDWVNGAGKSRVDVPLLLPELQTSKTLAIGHQSDLFIRFPFGKNALPQLELLAMITAMVPTDVKNQHSLRLTPVLQKNLWRDVYLAYLIKNYPEAELWRLGAEAMLVERFIGKVEPTGRRMNSSQDYERRLLVATVVRHRTWAANISEHAAIDEFPCKDPVPFEQQPLELQSVNMLTRLAEHSRLELLYARQQVILCTGAVGVVSAEPSLKHQGVLF